MRTSSRNDWTLLRPTKVFMILPVMILLHPIRFDPNVASFSSSRPSAQKNGIETEGREEEEEEEEEEEH